MKVTVDYAMLYSVLQYREKCLNLVACYSDSHEEAITLCIPMHAHTISPQFVFGCDNVLCMCVSAMSFSWFIFSEEGGKV